MTPGPPNWAPGWLTIGIAGAAGFLLGVVVLVVARGVVHDTVRTKTVVRSRTVVVQPKVPDVVGMTLGDARDTLSSKGYQVDAQGGGFFSGPSDGDTVSDQDPPGGAVVGGGATITLFVG